MTPILYEKDEIDFTSQGLGSLVEIYDANVAEQRNGLLQLTASYPVTGVRYDDISVGRIILAKPNQRDEPHAFRITIADLDIMGHNVMIEADSITYDLNHNIVKHVSANGQSGQAMMTALQMAVVNPSIFTFYSDITHVSSTSLDYVNPMEAVMGVKGSFLQIWGGELKRENRRVAMFNRRGRDNVATFRLGKNISGLKYKVDISSLVTRILPIKIVQENDTTTYLEGTPVSSQYINSYEQIYTIKVDFTDDTIKTVDDLNKAAEGWFVDSANTGRDKPSVTIDIDVLSLQDSADYQDKFKDLESVALTDTVTVYVPDYGINVTAIVNEIHFDPIQERVTKLTVGTARMSFADSSRVQLSDLQDKVISVQEQANQTAISANGKNTNYYGSIAPSHPQEGDQWYWVNGDLSGIKQFVNGDWVDLVDSNTQQLITDSVDQALTEANAYSDQLVAENASQINTVLDDVQAKQADLTAQQAELDTKAQEYANKALTDAKADTLATAVATAKTASDALATAKTDLTTNLNKEVTDRANAVTALDTKAKGYADTAKADAIATANGAVAKEVTDRQKAITDLDAKSTTSINQAKTDAQSALDALQVGGRNYVLNSNISITGSNATKNPLMSSVSTSDFSNKPLVLSVQVDYDNITALDSSTLKRLGFEVEMVETNGKHRWKSIWVYPKIGESFHGRVYMANQNNGEQYIDTRSLVEGLYIQGVTGTDVKLSKPKLEIGNKATDYTQAPEDIVLDYTTKDNVISQSLTRYQATNDGNVSKAQSDATQALGLVATKVSQTDYNTKTGDLDSKYTAVKQTADQASTDIVAIKSTNTSQDTKINTLTSDVSGTKQSISDIQTEQGKQSTKINTIQTDVSGTKQDIIDIQTKDGEQDTRMGTIETSVDGVSANFTSYKSTNDGKVTTAQSTATQALNGLTTKVSQTDYNTKTGDLTTKVNTAQSTADSVTTSLNTYKSSNDGKVNKAQADIVVNTNAIATKVAQTTYDTKTNQLQTDLNTTTTTANTAKTDIVAIKSDNTKQDARMLQIESDANGTKTTVSNLQMDLGTANGSITTLQQRADGFDATVTKVNGLSVGGRNYVLNSKKSTTSYSDAFKSSMPTSGFSNKWLVVSTQVDYDNITALPTGSGKNRIGVEFVFPKIGGGAVYLSAWNFPTIGGSFHGRIYQAIDATKITFADTINNGIGGIYVQNITGTNVVVSNPKLEIGTFATDYTQAPEDVDNKISTVSQTVDGISSIVSDPDTGLTKRVQTAEGTLTQVTGADIPALQKATYWQAPNGYDLNTYLAQGSFFFRDTTARTNSPTTSTKWMYLTVDRNAQGDRVTQTVWYDTQTDAKITYRRQYSGTWGAWYANDNDSVATIAQTNGVIQTEISNRATGDTNTLTQAKDFTTSSITSSETGMKSLITQTSDSIIAKVDTKTNSATVLSLLKDNWSIGITGNTSALASGIAADPSAMAIVSPKVIIDSPQTQITGTAWIKTAMIADGQISTAKIGDASITSAKIFSLDVNKLTGNVSNFIQSNWNGVFASTMIDNTGMSINGGNTTTKFDTSGAHFSNGSGINATYSFGKWSDQSGNATSSTGLYLGATGSENSFINILGTNGAAAAVLAGTAMDFGANVNVVQGAFNFYTHVNIRERLLFKGNRISSPSYIEINETSRTFNFFTGGGIGTDKNYFYFNQNVISAGTFSSTSVLSKKNVKSNYDEDALGEIAKTQLVNFEYKNRIGQNHVSPIIDDVNSEKEYYIPKTILGQDNEYVDMYSMISMAWRAIQQLNEKIGEK